MYRNRSLINCHFLDYTNVGPYAVDKWLLVIEYNCHQVKNVCLRRFGVLMFYLGGYNGLFDIDKQPGSSAWGQFIPSFPGPGGGGTAISDDQPRE